ncbi:T9SS type A sorting domain-containing protein [Bacteroidota bacterium]
MKRIILIVVILLIYKPIVSQENDLEVVEIKYRIWEDYNNWDSAEDIQSDKYIEILSGEQNLQPVVTIRNNSNEYKELEAKVIINNIGIGRYVYSRELIFHKSAFQNWHPSVKIFYYDSLYNLKNPPFDTNGWAIPPRSYIKIYFPEYSPNDLYDSHHGKYLIKAVPNEIKDSVFIRSYDTSYANFNVVGWIKSFPWDHFKTYIENTDDSIKIKQTIPDDKYFASIGVELVDGMDYCNNVQLGYTIKRTDISWDTNFTGMGGIEGMYHYYKDSLIRNVRTVYKMNRVNYKGQDYQANGRYGDTLISGLLDLRDAENVNINIECERAGKIPISFDRGWSDSVLYGPEHRVILNGDCNYEYREPDKLIVELAFSNDPYILINPSDSLWNRIKQPGTNNIVQGEPALILFGGGGHYIGLPDSENNDSIPELICDISDDGKDDAFIKYKIKIPDYMINEKTGGYVRLRLRVDAEKNGNEYVKDDNDDFFIQNIYTIIDPDEGDLSVVDYRVLNPYTILHRDIFKLSSISVISNTNYTGSSHYYMNIKGQEQLSRDEFEYYGNDNLYFFDGNYFCRRRYFKNKSNIDVKIDIPFGIHWLNDNLKNRKKLDCITYGFLKEASFNYLRELSDEIYENNYLINFLELHFDDFYAFDNPEPQNDVEIETSGEITGISLYGYSDGIDSHISSYGFPKGNGSGQIAVRFEAYRDTIYGFQVYFPDVSQSPDEIVFSVYYNDSTNLPGGMLPASFMKRKTAFDELSGENKESGYITYLYGSDADTTQTPLFLDYGTYWIALSQLDEQGLNLGASGHRMGMVTTNYDTENDGDNGTSILIDDCWKTYSKTEGKLINQNYFAYENELGSGNWREFTPSNGNPGYSHLDHAGTVHGYQTFTRGSFVPMIRIYMNGSHYTWKEDPNYIVDDKKPNSFIIAGIFPNPIYESAELRYFIPVSGNIHICLYDIMGRKVKELYSKWQMRGDHFRIINAREITPGLYFINIEVSGINKYLPVIIE